MSLHKAIKSIKEEIGRRMTMYDRNSSVVTELDLVMSQLGIALEASERDSPHHSAALYLDEGLHAEYQKKRRIPTVEEEVEEMGGVLGEHLVTMVGGKEDGTTVPLEKVPPEGTTVTMGGEVYVFGKDRKFHYNEDQTKFLNQPFGGAS